MQPARRPGSALERILAALLAPIIAVWDVTGRGVMAFFAALERLDPITAVVAMSRRIAPWCKRQWAKVLPTLVRIREFLVRLRQRIAAFLYPLTRRIGAALSAVGEFIARPFRWLFGHLARAVAAVRTGMAPAVATAKRWWQAATAPLRSAGRAVRSRYRAVADWVTRRVPRIGRARRSGDVDD